MRLLIVRPLPAQLEGLPLTHLRFGASYDLPPLTYDLLLVSGYGVPVEGIAINNDRARVKDQPLRSSVLRRRQEILNMAPDPKRVKRLKELGDELDALCRETRILHDALKEELRITRARELSHARDAAARRKPKRKHR